jgi:hypothetical protein
MPVVAEAEDHDAHSTGALMFAAGGAEAVNLGVARIKGETKEEKKARKEAVKQQVCWRCRRSSRSLLSRSKARFCTHSPSSLYSSLSLSFAFIFLNHVSQRSANRAAKKQLKEA